MMADEMLNPWHLQSIYDLQFFVCPSCVYKNHSKQEFINHAYEMHPKSLDYLHNIQDDSLKDIIFPNNVEKIKEESISEKSSDDPLKLDIKSVETIKEEPILENSHNDPLEFDTQEIATEIDKHLVDQIDIKTEDIDIDDVHEHIETFHYEPLNKPDFVHNIEPKKNRYKCGICLMAFSEESLFKRHFDFMHSLNAKVFIKTYKCNLCEKIFSNLKEHQQNCPGTMKKHICPECGTSFTHIHKLNYHMSSVHQKNHIYGLSHLAPVSRQSVHNYKCDLCSLAFSEESLLKRHIDYVHYGPLNKSTAYYSEITVKQNKDVFKEHIKNYICQKCGAVFTHPHTLFNHINRVHKIMKIIKL